MIMVAESYLKKNLDERASVKAWTEVNLLPVFLRNSYNFYEMRILGTTCVLMEVFDESPGIDTLRKHIRRIETLTNHQIVLFYKDITRYRRKSLIEKRISFIIEDGQMYLPFLGIDLKKTPDEVQKEVKQFTVSAQIAFLYFLYHKKEIVNVTDFADRMGFTMMTASRALKELYHANLITYEIKGKTGRSKEYKRIPDPEYFLKGSPYLKTPVKKIVYTKTEPEDSLVAGIDALEKLSMLNGQGRQVRAISREKFNRQKIEIISNKDLIRDAKLIEIELWDYDPKQLSEKDHVDLLSLYVSLKEENDERIEQALEEVLRGEPWYTA